MKTRIQILIWQSPDIDTMEHRLDAKTVLFKTWDDDIMIGHYDIGSDNFLLEPNDNAGYYLFNDIKEFAIIKKSTE